MNLAIIDERETEQANPVDPKVERVFVARRQVDEQASELQRLAAAFQTTGNQEMRAALNVIAFQINTAVNVMQSTFAEVYMITEPGKDPRWICQVQTDSICGKPATEIVREPFTPARFKIRCCAECASDLIQVGYVRASEN